MVPHSVAFHNSTFAVFLLLLIIIIINVKIIVTLSQKNAEEKGHCTKRYVKICS